MFELRKNVNRVRSKSIGYRRFLYPQRDALEKLAHLEASWLEDDDRIHLAAAADRAARMAEELEAIRERASLTHDALTDLRAEQIDNRSLAISVIAMVFLPLTFVTGLYGMNVKGIWFAERTLGVRRDRHHLHRHRARHRRLVPETTLVREVSHRFPLPLRERVAQTWVAFFTRP